MGFNDSITALLETYSNCLKLLKSLRHRKEGNDTSKADQRQVTLLKSLKKDRSLVERTYSSRLSESGSRLKKGDARAISSLDRILKRIRVTVINLLRLSSKEPSPVLDYDSLMSLSNTSRIEAIKTINRLSRRLGSASPSRVSTTYTSTSTSTVKTPSPSPSTPPQAHPSRQKGHSSHRSSHSSSQHSTTTSTKKRDKSPAAPSSPKKKKSSTKVKDDMLAKTKADAGPKPREETKLARPREEASSSKPKEEKPPKSKDDAGHPTRPKEDVDTATTTAQPRQDKVKPPPSAPTKTRPSATIEFEETTPPPSQRTDPNMPARRPVGLAARVAAAAENRISIASFTSDSTKIGEIPDRKPGSRYYAPASPGSDQYNVAPLYPLRPYRVEPSGKGGERGFWGGLFGTKKKESSSSMSSSSS